MTKTSPNHKVIRKLILLTLLSALFLSSCGSVPELLTPAETLEAHNNGALIVDIRSVEDYEEFHIPKSINIPVLELSSNFDQMPLDQHIILVCNLGRSSLEARDILLEAGYNSVSSMEGGVMAWYDAGYPGISGQ
jgi:rhodanese-related sulfurtransferase